MTAENGGRVTGPSAFTPDTADPMFMAVWDAWEDVASPDDLPTTDKHVREFIDSLNIRGYQVTLLGCRPHEWTDEPPRFCVTCGLDG